MSEAVSELPQTQPLCYCYGITKDDVREHFRRPGSTYESLVDETRIATKCTACRLDLDLLLSELHAVPGGPSANVRSPETSDQGSGLGSWARPQDLSDAGFVHVDGDITTVLRVANQGLLFDDTTRVVPYKWTLRVFTGAGRLAAKRGGSLAVEQDVSIDFADLVDPPFSGWFLISLYPRGEGLCGTTRPQLIVLGAGWASPVHTQFLSMACRHKAALLFSEGGRTGAMISLINASRASNAVTISLATEVGRAVANTEIRLVGYGSRLANLDELFGPLDAEGILTVSVRSREPVAKHLILRNRDGSWSQNHFPNVK